MRTNEQRFDRLVSVTLLRMSGVRALFANGSPFPNTSRLFANHQRISGGSLRLGGPASSRDRNIRALDGGLHKFVHERTAKKPLTPKPIVK